MGIATTAELRSMLVHTGETFTMPGGAEVTLRWNSRPSSDLDLVGQHLEVVGVAADLDELRQDQTIWRQATGRGYLVQEVDTDGVGFTVARITALETDD